VIGRVFLNTPQYNCEPLSAALGCALTLKVETTNPIRCFKGRGASLLVHDMIADARLQGRAIVTASAGNGVRVPVPEAVTDMMGIVDDVLLVSDAQMIAAMRLVFAHAGLLVEPAGAAGVAALLAHGAEFSGRRVATVLCGSNLTSAQVREWMT
jgi:threonine dehydratase